jgi:hypothetical protein
MEMVYSQGSVRRLPDLLYLLKKKPMLCIIHRIGRKKNKLNARYLNCKVCKVYTKT